MVPIVFFHALDSLSIAWVWSWYQSQELSWSGNTNPKVWIFDWFNFGLNIDSHFGSQSFQHLDYGLCGLLFLFVDLHYLDIKN